MNPSEDIGIVKTEKSGIKKALSLETLVFFIIFGVVFGALGYVMGGINLINTIINSAYDLLMNTAFYIMAVAVVTGALSELLLEFGAISAANKLLSPLIKPIFGLPGASMIGICTTYLSDNPAILTFGNNMQIRKYFKKYQLPALTNIGTAFGMGLIVTAFCAGLSSPNGENMVAAVLIGNLGAIIGGFVSTRLMLVMMKKKYGKDDPAPIEGDDTDDLDVINFRRVRNGSFGSRFMTAALDGGGQGVKLGLQIIPGILIITTLVMLFTNGPSESGAYTGAAYEGIGLLPYLGNKIDFILKPMFGFLSPEGIVVPLTALGAAGSAISLIPDLLAKGLANAHDVCVFTATCMCFSGYLCTHVVMMESLGYSKDTGKAIMSHTIGGIVAGVAANILYNLIM